MLKLHKLEIENFMGFKGKHSLDFNSLTGAVLIEGKTDDPKSPSNGAGKSSVYDSLLYVLYGSPIRNTQYADNIIHGTCKESKLALDLSVDNKQCRIERKRKRNGTELAFITDEETYTKNTAQEKIQEIIGFTELSFGVSVMFGKDLISFADLKSTERFKIVSNLFPEIQRWDKSLAYCQSQSKTIEQQLHEQRQKLDNTVAKRTELRDLHESVLIKAESHETKKAEKVSELEKQYKLAKKKERVAKRIFEAAVEYLTDAMAMVDDEIKQIEKRITTNKYSKEKEKKARQIAQKAAIEVSSIERELASIKRDITKYTKLNKGPCSNCGQEITGKLLDDKLNELQGKALGFDQQLINDQNALADAETNEEAIVSERDALYNLQTKLDKLKSEKKDYLSSATTISMGQIDAQTLNDVMAEEFSMFESTGSFSLKEIKKRIIEINGYKKQAELEENPYQEQADEIDDRLANLDQLLSSIEINIEGIQDDLAYVLWWVKGFVKAKGRKIDSILSTFEALTNAYMERFSSDIRISYDTEKETKAGSIKDSFEIVVQDSMKTLPFSMWSSGQKQKLRMAISFGLADLMYDSQDNVTNVLCIDEPNDGLDEAGREELFYVIKERCQKYGQTVLMTDHNAYFKQLCDNTITVVMENGCSRIEEGVL